MLRRFVCGGLVFGIVGLCASAAGAGVTVSPDSAVQGAKDVELAFRVSNVEPVAITKAQLFVPTRPPIASVFAQSVQGWTAKVVTQHLATPIPTNDGDVSDIVSQVEWTADSAASGIQHGDFQSFEVLIGPLPYTSTVVFKVFETYSNGDVVRWVDTQSQSGADSGVPAPVLRLTPPTAPSTAASPAADAAFVTRIDSQVESARTIALIGIVVGMLGLLLGGLAFATRRRPG